MEPNDPAMHALYAYTKALAVALDYRDQPTYLHSERVGDLATALAIHLGLSGIDIEAIHIAAAFHDIGKIGVPDHILMKPAALDQGEWEIMKQHAAIGEQIIHATGISAAERASHVIRHHHEHFDGSGYPDGLQGTHIPICSRIISLVDSYDAMAVTRRYHSARSHDEIMAILHDEIGFKHDPALMQDFCRTIESDEFRSMRH
ncbi:MAG: HD domain-containing phosphohydrolase [Pseudomonadota bacterium]